MHHEAFRKWDIREFRRTNDDKLIGMPNLITKESSKALVLVAEATRNFDYEGHLPFQYVIDSAVRAVVDHSFPNMKLSKWGSESEDDTDVPYSSLSKVFVQRFELVPKQ